MIIRQSLLIPITGYVRLHNYSGQTIDVQSPESQKAESRRELRRIHPGSHRPMSKSDFVPQDEVLELLRDHPDGLTVREVADKLETSNRAAQNALRKLHMMDKADVKQPTTVFESKRWVHES